MQALVLTEPLNLQLKDEPRPSPKEHELLVRVRACGICGSDVHGYDGSTGRRVAPLIMVHEAAGEVIALGAKARRFKLGDRVTFDSTVSCGTCQFCKAGSVNLCVNRQVLGVSCEEYRRDGAFAEYVSIPEHIVYPLPDTFNFEKAALIEAVSIAVHAAKLTGIKAGSTALIVGAGMIGLLAVQAFRVFGCAKIIAIDLDQSRLDLAKRLGADSTYLATDPNLRIKIQGETGGEGPEIAVEVVGAQKSITTAIENVRKGGTITLIGNLSPSVDIPLQTVVTRQLTLLGSCASAGEYPECIQLMDLGAINVEPLISVVAPLSEGALWFRRLYDREPGLMKVILQPQEIL